MCTYWPMTRRVLHVRALTQTPRADENSHHAPQSGIQLPETRPLADPQAPTRSAAIRSLQRANEARNNLLALAWHIGCGLEGTPRDLEPHAFPGRFLHGRFKALVTDRKRRSGILSFAAMHAAAHTGARRFARAALRRTPVATVARSPFRPPAGLPSSTPTAFRIP